MVAAPAAATIYDAAERAGEARRGHGLEMSSAYNGRAVECVLAPTAVLRANSSRHARSCGCAGRLRIDARSTLPKLNCCNGAIARDKAAGQFLRSSLNSFEFRGVFGRRWLHRETVDDRRRGFSGASIKHTSIKHTRNVCRSYRSRRLAATATPAREQRLGPRRGPRRAPSTCLQPPGSRTGRATAARKLQAPPGEPWRATPRGQRARASSTPTARGPSRGGRGACSPSEAWGGTT